MRPRRQATEQLFDGSLIVDDELTLGATLFGPTEEVERSSAQEAQSRQQLERREHPRPILALDQLTSVVTPCQQRRRKVKAQRVVALELCLELLPKFTLRVQPRHLVLVLVGEQFEVVAGHCVSKARLSLRLALLGFAHALDQIGVALPIRRILIARQELDSTRHHLL